MKNIHKLLPKDFQLDFENLNGILQENEFTFDLGNDVFIDITAKTTFNITNHTPETDSNPEDFEGEFDEVEIVLITVWDDGTDVSTSKLIEEISKKVRL